MGGGRLAAKTLVIVGGTSGMGLSATRACVQAGAAVVVVGRDADKCASVQNEFGDRVRAVVGDASQPGLAELAVERAVAEFGPLHGLYHVAGGSGRSHGDGPLHLCTDDGWHYTQRLNLDSLFYANRAAVQQFLRQGQGGGSVLNMASVLAWSPAPRHFGTLAYATTKAGAIGLTIAAAAYYASHQIRFNVLAPALVETPLAQRAASNPQIMQYIRAKQPLDGGRIGQPEDLDEAVIYFLSDGSRFVTGQVLAIDGGWSLSEGQDADTTEP
jgi:NAD(P)-dependent dehydrogenase (short-subunit alcohol dehydrogenase family)